jgi:phosphoribosylamine--glycine ligase
MVAAPSVTDRTPSPAAASRVLVVGGGSREHAIAHTLHAEGAEVFMAPGNAGTGAFATNLPIPVTDLAALVAAAQDRAVDLVVVGPEGPLVEGLSDRLREAGIPTFGPSGAAARLEASKIFMKEFLARHAIPTATFAVFDDAAKANAHLRALGRPLVVKADGLAAGKGVVVPKTVDEACEAVTAFIDGRLHGEAGARVVLEDFLPGEEASFHVLCDGERYVALPAAQDHKRVRDRDEGPNTGGMGAYAPAPVVTEAVKAKVLARVVEPTLRGMAAEGNPFRGVLFVGLMIEDGEPRVLEFNVRFGDPETCVLMPIFRGHWRSLLLGAATGSLPAELPAPRPVHALGVVMAADGYPEKVTTGDAIEGLDAGAPEGVVVHHAGTRLVEGRVVTSGGRVLCVAAEGATLEEARDRAYARVATVRYRGEHHRSDIGARALRG